VRAASRVFWPEARLQVLLASRCLGCARGGSVRLLGGFAWRNSEPVWQDIGVAGHWCFGWGRVADCGRMGHQLGGRRRWANQAAYAWAGAAAALPLARPHARHEAAASCRACGRARGSCAIRTLFSRSACWARRVRTRTACVRWLFLCEPARCGSRGTVSLRGPVRPCAFLVPAEG
jgi:hypothetical protein